MLETAGRDRAAFDVALLDYHLPDRDGLALAEAIRARPDGRDLPLVLLSSALCQDHRAAIERCRFAGAFQKPVRRATLQRILESLWRDPAAADATPAGSTAHAVAVPSAATGPAALILIAEDNVVNQKLAVRLVQKLGHRTEVVANGQEALAALERAHFDLVLMDCQMPEIDGYAATREWRRREADTGRRLPIIALTANALIEERAHCLAAGMDDYLAKPVRFEALAATLTRWLATTPALPPGALPPPPPSPPPPEHLSLNT
jgi:CheY-like chemotaxis protein